MHLLTHNGRLDTRVRRIGELTDKRRPVDGERKGERNVGHRVCEGIRSCSDGDGRLYESGCI